MKTNYKHNNILSFISDLTRKRSRKSIIKSFSKYFNTLNSKVSLVYLDKQPRFTKGVYPIGSSKMDLGYFVFTGDVDSITLDFESEFENALILLGSILENISLKKTEKELIRYTSLSEDHSQLFANLTFEAIFLSEKGICIDQNKTAELLFGYSTSEALGRPGTDWIIPEDRGIVRENMLNGVETPYDVTALKKDGTTFPCEIQAKEIDYFGRPVRVTALRDVTGRIEAEQLYASIRESTTDGFVILDMKGNLQAVNDIYCQKMGYTREELLEKNILDLDPFTNISTLKRKFKEITQKMHLRFEVVNQTKNGRLLTFEVSATYINQNGGYCVVFVNDITERLEQEDILRENEMMLRVITDNFPNSYVSIIEKDMIISFSSGQEFTNQGLDPKDFINVAVDDVFGEHSKTIKNYYRQTFKGENCSFELHINNQDQLYKTVPIYNENKKVEKILVVVENITNRKQRERVIRCQVRLSELANHLSMHELLQAYLDEIEILTQSKIGFFHFVNDDQKTLTLQAWSSNTIGSFCTYEGQGLHYPISEAGVWVDCIHKRKTIVHNNYNNLKHKKGYPKGHPEIIREVIIPVIREKKILAVVGVGNKETEYTEQDIEVLNSMADIAWDTVSRKIAEEAHKENEHRFRMLFDNMNAGVAIYRPIDDGKDFVFVDINKFGENHSHVKRDDITGKSVREVFPGVVDIGLFDVFKRVYETGTPQELPLIQYKDHRIEEWVENYVFRLPSGLIVAIYEDTSDKQRAFEELAQSEARFRSLTENIPGVVYLCNNDDDYRMIYLNEEIKVLTGFPVRDFLSNKMPFMKLIHPEDLAYVQDTINKSLKNDRSYNLVYRLRHKDGNFKWVEEFGVGIGKTKDKQYALLEGYIHDISERINSENALKDSEEKFRTFFSSINDAVFVHPYKKSGFGKLIEVNEIACIRYGYTRDEFLQLTPSDFTVKRDAERHSKENHRKKLLENKSLVFQALHRKKSGETFPVEISSNIVELSGQKVILAVVRDISDRVKANEKLKESEIKFRSVVEQSNDAIYILRGKRFILINKKFTEITGVTREDTFDPKFDFMDYVAPKSKPIIRDKQLSRFKDGRKTDLYEFDIMHKDGTIVPVQASITEIEYEDEKAILGLLRDMTERKKLEQQLFHAQKIESIGHLTGGIAHDFNNLLTPILGNTELALLEMEPTDPLFESLEEIHETADHAKDLVHQLLAFSRKQILEVDTLDLNILINGFKSILSRTIREDIKIKTHLTHLSGNVKADRSQIEQVIMNLSVNAQDAMEKGGIITIETENVDVDDTFLATHSGLNKGPHVLLSISDTGYGIDQEKMGKIFDPFFTTKEPGKGTGLGLATVHGIIKQHNGDILVYSELGHGTTFKIYLPLVKGKSTKSIEKSADTSRHTGDSTILVVEDKDSVRRMAVRIIKFHGFKVLEAATPEEAIAYAYDPKNRIDLLLTDVIMPGMNGKELFDYILIKQPDIKVVFMSGYTQNVIAHHGVMDEGVNFIQKPFTLETLISTLNKVIND